MFRLLFALFATLVIIGMNAYVYTRFLKRIDLFAPIQSVLKWGMVGVVGLEMLFLLTLRHDTLTSEVFFVIAGFIGASFMLFCVAIVYDLVHLPLMRVRYDASRRMMLKGILDVTMLILALSYLVRGFMGGLSSPKITEVTVRLKGLEAPLEVVQLSDVHIGKVLGKAFLEEIVHSVNALDADIVVITGDLVDLEVESIGDALDPLLEIRSKLGVYFVPGNHEYFHGVEAILTHLESLHVRILGNTHVQVGGINLAGVYDVMASRMNHPLVPDITAALAGHNPDLPTVLLAHQPKYVTHLKGDEPIDLVLCGHTHAGQIFPFGLLVLLDQPYLYGLYQHTPRTQVFVSSGAGFWGPPVRVMAPSEIVKLSLRS
ncbi:MAG: metallophosphoesterase [Campylobacterales bacterium]|nr:metallophosphoesterase [Campylobacterales bacterium]